MCGANRDGSNISAVISEARVERMHFFVSFLFILNGTFCLLIPSSKII